MEILLGILGLAIAAFFGVRFGSAREREQTRKIAVEAEKHVKKDAADKRDDALKANERRFEHDMKRPADDVLTEAARRGGER